MNSISRVLKRVASIVFAPWVFREKPKVTVLSFQLSALSPPPSVRLAQRQLDREARSALLPVAGGDAPSRAFDDGARDGEAQTAMAEGPVAIRTLAHALRGVAGGEDCFEGPCGDARPVVLDSEEKAVRGALRGRLLAQAD